MVLFSKGLFSLHCLPPTCLLHYMSSQISGDPWLCVHIKEWGPKSYLETLGMELGLAHCLLQWPFSWRIHSVSIFTSFT